MSVETRRAQREGKTDTQRMLEAEKTKRGLTQAADIATDFIPGVSETKDIISLGQNVKKGDYLAAGADAVALGLGAVPVVGDIARRGFKSLVTPKKIRKAYKLFVQREDGLYPLFVDAKNKIPEKEFIEAKFPEEAFTAPNGRTYVPSKGAKRESKIQYIDPDGKKITKAQYDKLGDNAKKQSKKVVSKREKQQATGESIIIPDEKTRKKLIEKGYITDRVKRTEEAPFGKVTAVAARPGFHASQFPVATHIGPQDIKISKKEAQKLIEAGITPEAIKRRKGQLYVKRRAEDHVYAEVDMADDVDYQSMLAKEGKTDINDRVPVGGSYKYVDGQADSDKWVVGGNMRVNKVLSKEETKKLQEELGVKDLPSKEDVENILGKKFSQGGSVEGDNMYQGVDDYVLAKTNPEQMDMNKGGTTMEKDLQAQQLEMFGDVGKMVKAPNVKDPVSGNEIPKASTAEEVRDDIPARLSEGEFVLPADVVRYHGLEKLMKLRQSAKQGINMMDDMGQLGNSEQATMSDELPFTPNKMQEGGVVQPQVNQQNVVPGVKFTAPKQQTLRPSVYTQPAMQPAVQKAPTVNVPTQPTYTAQVLNQQPQKTDTAATPTFKQLIGAPFGQLQKSETKKYINEQTGEELYIPFIDGQPIYPIPEGYKFEGDIKKEEEEKQPVKTTVDTARVTQDTGGDDGGFTAPDTPEYRVASTLASQKGGGIGGAISSLIEKVTDFGPISILKNVARDMMPAPKMQPGFDLAEAFEADRKVGEEANQNSIARGMGYASYDDLKNQIGVEPSFAFGTNPGDISLSTGKFFNEYGQSENPTTGEVAYTSFTDFVNAMGASAKSGWFGGIESAKQAAKNNNSKAISFLNEMNVKYEKEDAEKKDDKKPSVTLDDINIKQQEVKDPKEIKTLTQPSDVFDPTSKPTTSFVSGKPTGAVGSTGGLGPAGGIGQARGVSPASVSFGESSGGDSGQTDDDATSGGSQSGDTGLGSESYSTAVGGFIPKKKTKTKKMKRGGLASRK